MKHNSTRTFSDYRSPYIKLLSLSSEGIFCSSQKKTEDTGDGNDWSDD